jgi:toxin YoeB
MSYQIDVLPDALEGIEKLKKHGDLAALKKLDELLKELREHPKTGTGKPEQLKYNYSGKWSRKISEKHRLIYEIDEEVVTVIVLSTFGHYKDK